MNQFIQGAYKDSKTREQEAFDKELQAATESILEEIDGHHKVSNIRLMQYLIQYYFLLLLFKNQIEVAPKRSNNIEVEYINLGDAPNGLEGKGSYREKILIHLKDKICNVHTFEICCLQGMFGCSSCTIFSPDNFMIN